MNNNTFTKLTNWNYRFLLVFAFFTFISCAISPNPYEEADILVKEGDYSSAFAEIQAKEDYYGNKNAILYNLDIGMLAHYSNDSKTALDALSVAETGIQAAYTKSITENIGSFLLNDNTISYAGEDYEDIYINVFKALDYYKLGSYDSAMVEIRRIDGKLRLLINKYSEYEQNAESELSAKEKELGLQETKITRKSSQFSESALARYLSLIFYRGKGMMDDARIDRNAVRAAFKAQPDLYSFPIPKTLDEELNVKQKDARLNIIAFAGQAPIKKECISRVELNETYIKVVWPEIQQTPSSVASVQLVFDNGYILPLDIIEDIGAIATDTFNLKSTGLYVKSLIRGISKGVMTTVAASEADDYSSLISLVGTVFTEVSEQADTRLSRYYPSRAYITGITLKPGLYSFKICYLNESGVTIWSEKFTDVPVKAGTLNLQESVCLR